MKARELVGCCGLRVVYNLECLGLEDAWSRREAKKFDTIKVRGIMNGHNCGATIVTITDDPGFDEEDKEIHKRQVAFLKARGYKLLGKWPSKDAFSDPPYNIELWGSPEMKRR